LIILKKVVPGLEEAGSAGIQRCGNRQKAQPQEGGCGEDSPQAQKGGLMKAVPDPNVPISALLEG